MSDNDESKQPRPGEGSKSDYERIKIKLNIKCRNRPKIKKHLPKNVLKKKLKKDKQQKQLRRQLRHEKEREQEEREREREREAERQRHVQQEEQLQQSQPQSDYQTLLSQSRKSNLKSIQKKIQAHRQKILLQNVKFRESQELFQQMKSNDEKMRVLNESAFLCRVPSQKITALESYYFRDLIDSSVFSRILFITIRNKILHLWLTNPKIELTVDALFGRKGLEPPFDSDRGLVARIHRFLERFGLINFGVFKILRKPQHNNYHVIVIGAGIAGLAAANQLTRFGFRVTVVEGRNRVGGRISTFRKNNFIADLGAMVVTGLGGNPMSIISQQINMELHTIFQGCPLYDAAGQLIDKAKDEFIEKEFNRILESTSQMSHKLDLNYFDNIPLSLGQAIDFLISSEECRLLDDKLNYLNEIDSLKTKLVDLYEKLVESKTKTVEASQQCRTAAKAVTKDNPNSQLLFAQHRKSLKSVMSKRRILENDIRTIEKQLAQLQNEEPPDIYLTKNDIDVLNWHKANLEFANATPLENLSLKHWNQDDDFEFFGNHLTVRKGYSHLPESLAKNMNVQLNMSVTEIRYGQNEVEIAAKDANGVETKYHGDAVLCTLPLGVLKVSTADEKFKPNQLLNKSLKNSVKFVPELPDWKIDSIHRLGFGNLNKVILCFDKIFWDRKKNLFGHVNRGSGSRGEFFLFWYLYEKPVLLALIAGDAATRLEVCSNEIIVNRCLKVLRNIFGKSKVPRPKEVSVTRWRTDPFSYGSYSFVSTESSGFDYDLLAAPVSLHSATTMTTTTNTDGGGSSSTTTTAYESTFDSEHPAAIPRLFFAGEHTMRNYPATVHGAFLSGLREASRIADYFIGF